VPFFVHENWRWQTPIRELAAVLDSGALGHPFRARIQFSSSFPVFDNQPFLATLEQFLLTDIGSHILDVARFLFGEADTVFCQTHRAHKNIAGEDVATVMMPMRKQPDAASTTVVCEMSCASRLENERFPETFILVEGERGSAELGPGCRLAVTTDAGTHVRRVPPPRFVWADPAYDLVQSSMVPCLANLLAAIRANDLARAETNGADNLRTVRLVFAAYESARTGTAVRV
jgi:predicted dehydrogenase